MKYGKQTYKLINSEENREIEKHYNVIRIKSSIQRMTMVGNMDRI